MQNLYMKKNTPEIIQLHPEHREYRSVKGLYLSEELHVRARNAGKPVRYANFITSLDGRIAVSHHGVERLPESLSNANDLRLFLELLAQADCIITHGAYLRARAAGLLGDILHCDDELSEWRRRQQLAAPTIVVCSASLDFPVPADLARDRLIIATGQQCDAAHADQWRDRGYHVIIAGKQRLVEADALLSYLTERGFLSICFAAGPRLLESALQTSCLDLLYLTVSHQFIGGEEFRTLIPGIPLGGCRLLQKHLIFDRSDQVKYPQWFAKFELRGSGRTGH